MKSTKMLIIYLFIAFPLMAVCLTLTTSGKVTLFYSGFAVDSSSVLYIGKDAVIEKYSDEKKVGEISPKTSRGYAFTI